MKRRLMRVLKSIEGEAYGLSDQDRAAACFASAAMVAAVFIVLRC